MDSPGFRSELFYSVQNEDYRTELAVLRHLRRPGRLRVLMVASAGENPLSVLAEYPDADVHAVDTNAAQVHLCELRRVAVAHLARQEHLQLLGADGSAPGAAGAAPRLRLYETVRQHLPAPSRLFWDERRERELAFGVHFVGRNDVLMREIQNRLRVAGFTPFARSLHDDDLAAWQRAYGEVMTVPYFLHTFGLPSAAAAEKLAGLAPRVAECHFRALQEPDPDQNYFLTTAFENRYAHAAGEEGFPAYLQASGYRALREPETLDRLHLHVGSIFDRAKLLVIASGTFDLISISNIADWMDDRQFGEVVGQMRECLTSGGALLARTATGSRMIIDVMSRLLPSPNGCGDELARVERGPWFRTVAAGFRSSQLVDQ